MNIAEIRQKYPQYSDLSDQQLAGALHQKYYADMPIEEFTQKIGLQPSQAPKQEQKQNAAVGAAKGFASGVGKGATLGLSDEVQAGIGALVARPFVNVPLNELYDQGLQDVRSQQSAIAKSNPYATFAGEMVGSVLPATGMIKAGGTALATRAAAAPIQTAAGVGATQAGLYGFGAGEGSFGERATQAGISAPIGAGAGALGGYVGAKVGQYMAGRNTPAAAPAPVNLSQVQPAPKSAPVNLREAQKASGKVLDAIKKDYPQNWQSVVAAYEKGDVALADIAGEEIQSLAKGAAQYSGGLAKTRPYFDERTLASPDRLRSAVKSNISPNVNYLQTVDDIIEAGQKEAAPLYQKAFSKNKTIVSPEINRILNTPAGKKALKDAVTIMQNDRSLVGLPDKELKALADDVAAIGLMDEVKGPISKGLNLRTLDYVKKALDSQIKGAYANPEMRHMGSIINGQKNALLSELDKADKTGLYRAARERAGDYLQTSKMMEYGRRFTAEDPEFLDKIIKTATPQEMQSFKVGVAKKIRDLIDSTPEGANPYNRIFGTEAQKKRLAAILSPQEYNLMEKSLKAENRLFKMRNEVLGGSPTTSKAIAAAKIAGDAVDISQIATGDVSGVARKSLTAAVRKMFDGLNDNTAAAVASMIFEKKPENKLLLLEKTLKSGLTEPQKAAVKQAFFSVDKYINSRALGAGVAATSSADSVNQAIGQ